MVEKEKKSGEEPGTSSTRVPSWLGAAKLKKATFLLSLTKHLQTQQNKIICTNMNRATKAVISSIQATQYNLKSTALFHSTPVLQRKRRASPWDTVRSHTLSLYWFYHFF